MTSLAARGSLLAAMVRPRLWTCTTTSCSTAASLVGTRSFSRDGLRREVTMAELTPEQQVKALDVVVETAANEDPHTVAIIVYRKLAMLLDEPKDWERTSAAIGSARKLGLIRHSDSRATWLPLYRITPAGRRWLKSKEAR